MTLLVMGVLIVPLFFSGLLFSSPASLFFTKKNNEEYFFLARNFFSRQTKSSEYMSVPQYEVSFVPCQQSLYIVIIGWELVLGLGLLPFYVRVG